MFRVVRVVGAILTLSTWLLLACTVETILQLVAFQGTVVTADAIVLTQHADKECHPNMGECGLSVTVAWGAPPNRSIAQLYTDQNRRRGRELTALTDEQYHRLEEGDSVRIVNNGKRTVLEENVTWQSPLFSGFLTLLCGLATFLFIRGAQHLQETVPNPEPPRFAGRTIDEWVAFGQEMQRRKAARKRAS